MSDEPRPRLGAPPVFIDYGLIAAAFGRQGYAGATMASIAAEAGVAKPTLYRRFESKERLYELAVDHQCEALVARLFAAYEEAATWPLEERIRHGVAAYFNFVSENVDAFRLLFSGEQSRPPAVARLIDQTFRRIAERIAEMTRPDLKRAGSPAGQVADILAAAIVGLSDYLARQTVEQPSWDNDAVIDLLANLWSQALLGARGDVLAAADRPAR
jgi:AcrR family transcriptional regulator